MEGDHKIVVWLQLQRLPTSWWTQAWELLEQGVDHRIADEEDAIVGNPGAPQIVIGSFAGGEKPVGDGVGHDPVDFFRHGPVA